jgi:hypothetical protein
MNMKITPQQQQYISIKKLVQLALEKVEDGRIQGAKETLEDLIELL